MEDKKYDIKKDIKYLEDNGVIFGEWQDIEDDFYHGSPGISASGLKTIISKCPAKYKYGKSMVTPKSEALMLGSAIHKYILEHDDFDKHFLISPANKKTERQWKVFANQYKDDERPILRSSQGEMLQGIFDSLRKSKDKEGTNTYNGVIIHPDAVREQALYIVDKELDIILKIKVDIRIKDTFFDLKSTKDAGSKGFAKDAANLLYFVQAAFYLYVAKQADKEANTFGFVAVEKEPPYVHGVILVEDEDIKNDTSRIKKVLKDYSYYLHNDIWPAYEEVDKNTGKIPLFRTLAAPSWYRYEREAEQNFEG